MAVKTGPGYPPDVRILFKIRNLFILSIYAICNSTYMLHHSLLFAEYTIQSREYMQKVFDAQASTHPSLFRV